MLILLKRKPRLVEWLQSPGRTVSNKQRTRGSAQAQGTSGDLPTALAIKAGPPVCKGHLWGSTWPSSLSSAKEKVYQELLPRMGRVNSCLSHSIHVPACATKKEVLKNYHHHHVSTDIALGVGENEPFNMSSTVTRWGQKDGFCPWGTYLGQETRSDKWEGVVAHTCKTQHWGTETGLVWVPGQPSPAEWVRPCLNNTKT